MPNYTGPLLSLTSPLNDYVIQCELTWNSGSGGQLTQTATLINSWQPGVNPTGNFATHMQGLLWLSFETFQKAITDLATLNSYTEATIVTQPNDSVSDFQTVAIVAPTTIPKGVTVRSLPVSTCALVSASRRLLFKGSVPVCTKPLNDYFIEGVMVCSAPAKKRIGLTLLNSGESRKRIRGCYKQGLERVYVRLSQRMFGDLKRKLETQRGPADIVIVTNRAGMVVDLSI